MYIEPFWCGVIATLLAEALVCAVLIAKASKISIGENDFEESE